MVDDNDNDDDQVQLQVAHPQAPKMAQILIEFHDDDCYCVVSNHLVHLVTVEPVFYVPLFYMKPVFYMILSRTKWTVFIISKLYFTGTSHLREENLVPWCHVKYRFHYIVCTIPL